MIRLSFFRTAACFPKRKDTPDLIPLRVLRSQRGQTTGKTDWLTCICHYPPVETHPVACRTTIHPMNLNDHRFITTFCKSITSPSFLALLSSCDVVVTVRGRKGADVSAFVLILYRSDISNGRFETKPHFNYHVDSITPTILHSTVVPSWCRRFVVEDWDKKAREKKEFSQSTLLHTFLYYWYIDLYRVLV